MDNLKKAGVIVLMLSLLAVPSFAFGTFDGPEKKHNDRRMSAYLEAMGDFVDDRHHYWYMPERDETLFYVNQQTAHPDVGFQHRREAHAQQTRIVWACHPAYAYNCQAGFTR